MLEFVRQKIKIASYFYQVKILCVLYYFYVVCTATLMQAVFYHELNEPDYDNLGLIKTR
jgi:hypothetical protein